MTTESPAEAEAGLDAGRVAAWLAETVDADVSSVDIRRLEGGHSSGAWLVRPIGGTLAPLVLKAPEMPSVVYRRDACREAGIIESVHHLGAPVPAMVAVDHGTSAVGRPCFVMEYIESRSVSDGAPGGYHGDKWLRDGGPDLQRSVWESFHDSLAAPHQVDGSAVPTASHGPSGVRDVLGYWRDALLDVATTEGVPRQLAVLEWLGEHVPDGADDEPAVCLGDARLVNGLIVGTEVHALVDFEVAYLGHPAADIGYSLFSDALQRGHTPEPLPGIPSSEETWRRWNRATGRPLDHREYWTAFGATIAVTATRAMTQWGLAGPALEQDNPVVEAWEQAVERAVAR